MTTIYLIRHGETSWNKERRFQGHTDVSLSEKGVWQAQRVGEKLKNTDFSAIYSSDLQRAQLTAQKLAEKKKMPVLSCRELREIDFGEWEGKNYSQIIEKHPEEARNWFRDPGSTTVPGGESSGDISHRLQYVLDNIVRNHSGQKVAVFSHGGPIR